MGSKYGNLNNLIGIDYCDDIFGMCETVNHLTALIQTSICRREYFG